jgi:diadenosine tetraphosphatase ApaH/serine/threonine PP2A family protein phosphatase
MRVAVVSDIHANLPALEAVLAAVDEEAPDEVWCLGDVVGYGPHPNECCAVVRERAGLCLAGNHDLAVIGTISIDAFSGDAAAAARWTQTVLDPREREFLATLEPAATRPETALFHGSPLDPVWSYVLDAQSAYWSFLSTNEPLVLVGHSHVALQISYDGEAVDGGLAPGGTEVDLGGQRRLLNPGSVGQPRDDDARAAWVLLDLEAQHASFRRVVYPVDETQAAIREHGLPEALAARLATGR